VSRLYAEGLQRLLKRVRGVLAITLLLPVLAAVPQLTQAQQQMPEVLQNTPERERLINRLLETSPFLAEVKPEPVSEETLAANTQKVIDLARIQAQPGLPEQYWANFAASTDTLLRELEIEKPDRRYKFARDLVQTYLQTLPTTDLIALNDDRKYEPETQIDLTRLYQLMKQLKASDTQKALQRHRDRLAEIGERYGAQALSHDDDEQATRKKIIDKLLSDSTLLKRLAPTPVTRAEITAEVEQALSKAKARIVPPPPDTYWAMYANSIERYLTELKITSPASRHQMMLLAYRAELSKLSTQQLLTISKEKDFERHGLLEIMSVERMFEKLKLKSMLATGEAHRKRILALDERYGVRFDNDPGISTDEQLKLVTELSEAALQALLAKDRARWEKLVCGAHLPKGSMADWPFITGQLRQPTAYSVLELNRADGKQHILTKVRYSVTDSHREPGSFWHQRKLTFRFDIESFKAGKPCVGLSL